MTPTKDEVKKDALSEVVIAAAYCLEHLKFNAKMVNLSIEKLESALANYRKDNDL